MSLRALYIALPAFPLDMLVITYLLSPYLGLGLIDPSSPWWAYGPVGGFLLALGGFLILRWMNLAQSTNSTPESLDLDGEAVIAHLPPVQGSHQTSLREITVPWDQVQKVATGGLLRPPTIVYRRGATPSSPASDVRGDFLLLTKENAIKVDQAWTLWKAKKGQTPVATPLN